ncbi:hypothetical protein PBY51_023154 [Eleginops maclovinus]|uniref:Uncharacterized protein n=1 Tax=Eleginops maclovinus TaxID=56733 RepID=A0AAN7X1P5_ELEMC|nr:hypothetical protein PBY51_023154 [Eleginops maclovinus]
MTPLFPEDAGSVSAAGVLLQGAQPPINYTRDPDPGWRAGRPACLKELCPVCGDKVSGYHYGLLTCESCKGFFKRTVQNNKQYVCAEKQECTVDRGQRKRCPSCRFHKCLHVGMRLEAVRADRKRGGRNKFGPMYKRDRALKQQREALIHHGGFRLDSGPPLGPSTHHMHLTFTNGFHPLPMAQPPPLCSLLPFPPLAGPQYQCSSLSNWTVKSQHSNDGSAARIHSFSPQAPRMPQLVMEFLHCEPDELQLQSKIAARILQEEPGAPSTFSLMCVMADQTLFSIVEWARTSVFFKQLKVDDQMKLLHSCWSELLLLDTVCRNVLQGREGSLLLVTGQEVELSYVASHAGLTLAGLVQRGQELVEKLLILKVDRQEIACIKFLVLFNPDVKQLEDHQFVESVHEQAEAALLEYTLCTSAHLLGRFAHLLLCLSEIRSLSTHAEDYLYCKHLSGGVPCNNLLIEMLHAKRSCA